MKSLLTRTIFPILFLAFSQSGLSDELKVNVLGCVLSLNNVSNITVNGAANISFMYQQSESSPLRIITVSKYVGDKSWYLEKRSSSASHTKYGNYLNFEIKTMTFDKKFPPGTEFQFLTDKKVMLVYKGDKSEMANLLNCIDNPKVPNDENPNDDESKR